MRVFESGVGSGALSTTMLRVGADVVGYELREDFANRARTNVRSFLGDEALERYRVELRDAYEGIDDGPFDRVVLDLPSRGRSCRTPRRPWRPAACCARTRRASCRPARRERRWPAGPWVEARTLEVLHRTWHVEGLAVRPDHRMVAHTGFLTAARLLTR